VAYARWKESYFSQRDTWSLQTNLGNDRVWTTPVVMLADVEFPTGCSAYVETDEEFGVAWAFSRSRARRAQTIFTAEAGGRGGLREVGEADDPNFRGLARRGGIMICASPADAGVFGAC